jgi:prepilin-type N-terminal cleavage/methylation domain-containing protein/prepilin-type processing-associated H-X9-DG protein
MSKDRSRLSGFTLVELLVVIGIIAVLMSVLLPALNSARRSANTTKCAAALKEIGNAFRLYSAEYTGFYPPSRIEPIAGRTYTLSTGSYTAGTPAYWYDFLAKYMTRNRTGVNATASELQKGIFWGCTEWPSYLYDNAPNFVQRQVQTGYGMNTSVGFTPTFSPYNTAAETGDTLVSVVDNKNWIENWGAAIPTAPAPRPGTLPRYPSGTGVQRGNFRKESLYTRFSSDRALIADSFYWSAEALQTDAAGTNLTIPDQRALDYATPLWPGPAITLIDMYRHGKRPVRVGDIVKFTKKDVRFNALYCDGSVRSSGDPSEAYRSIRLKFPR